MVTQDDDGYVVRTGAYLYAIDSEETGSEVFAWHWHPVGASWCKWPHLHAPHGLGDHLPTGRTALEQIVRWLIAEVGIEPRRDDWTEILEVDEADYRQRRSWA